jgi:hypothetical protein
VKSLRFKVLATTVGLWMAHSLPALALGGQEPSMLNLAPGNNAPAAVAVNVNQQLADSIAGQLRASGRLQGYSINVRAENGVVDLTGQVANAGQREEAIRLVQGTPGVERVRDLLTVAQSAVVATTAEIQPPSVEPRALPSKDAFQPPMPGTLSTEPMPIFRAPAGPAGCAPGFGCAPQVGGMPPPPMPPYAWPTYAPYNNVSRVAYPNLYPYQSWPFIGPMYPYPKVPLGWRSVQLKWQDGHWWYGRTACGHDWWRVRYW